MIDKKKYKPLGSKRKKPRPVNRGDRTRIRWDRTGQKNGIVMTAGKMGINWGRCITDGQVFMRTEFFPS